MPRAPVVLTVGLLLSLSLSGCVDLLPGDDEGGAEGPPGPEEPPNIACDRVTVPGQRDGQRGEVLYLSCRGTAPGTQRGEIDCQAPESAELRAGADLGAGTIRVAVQDAGGRDLANTTLGDTSGEPRNLSLDTQGAEPGTWSLWVQRSQDYRGEHRVELWCTG